MTLNQIAFTVAEAHNRQNDPIYIERIKFAVTYWRSFLLRQDIERNGNKGEYSQTITMPLKMVDKLDSCYIDIGCKVLRTIDKVPLPLSTKGMSIFNYVGKPNLKEAFGYKNISQLPFIITGKKNSVFYTWNNGYIYIWGDTKIEYLTISGIFSDPLEAVEACLKTENCVSHDDPYPVPSHFIKTIIEGLISGEYEIRNRTMEILNRDKIDAN